MVKISCFVIVLVFLSADADTRKKYLGNAASICTQAPDIGNCSAITTMWYYNVLRGKCRKFVYSTCGGNDNRFEDWGSCMLVCGSVPRPKHHFVMSDWWP